jgi:hypothetical protein
MTSESRVTKLGADALPLLDILEQLDQANPWSELSDAERRQFNHEAEIRRLREREAELLREIPQSAVYCSGCRTEVGGWRTTRTKSDGVMEKIVKHCARCGGSGLLRQQRA